MFATRVLWVGCFALLVAGVCWAGIRAPATVSPGDSRGALTVDICPTFSWGAVPGTSAYELVVYRLGEEGEELERVMAQRIEGSALAWTPPLEQCLARGGRYAWSVRADGNKGSSEWSSPRLFEVVSGLSLAEFEEALQVVRQYLSGGGEGEERGKGKPTVETRPEPRSETEKEAVAESRAAAAAATTQLSVEGGVEAAELHLGNPGSGWRLAETAGDLHLEDDLGSGSVILPADGLVVGANQLVAAGGKVGIGILSPFAKFEIEAPSGVMPFLARTGGNVALEVKPVGPEVFASNLHVGGKVGIGISNPFSDFEIEAASGVVPMIIRSAGVVALEVRPAGPEVFASSLLVGGQLEVQGDVVVDGTLECASCVGQEAMAYGCGTYMHAGSKPTLPGGWVDYYCPFEGNAWGETGPPCDQVPTGSFCESDGECGLDNSLDNCGDGDWYLRID